MFAVRHIGFSPRPVPYLEGWALQREVHAAVVAGDSPDTLLLLEHEAVYTAGKRTEAHERPADGTPVVDVDRGGKITWHGPGQLVGYPILRLPEPVDVVAHVRRLERLLVEVVGGFGVDCFTVAGRSGVWTRRTVREEKIAAIGVRVEKGVTMHGFALNCDNSLDGFGGIVPCGIADAGVTTLSRELGRTVAVAEAVPAVERVFAEEYSGVSA